MEQEKSPLDKELELSDQVNKLDAEIKKLNDELSVKYSERGKVDTELFDLQKSIYGYWYPIRVTKDNVNQPAVVIKCDDYLTVLPMLNNGFNDMEELKNRILQFSLVSSKNKYVIVPNFPNIGNCVKMVNDNLPPCDYTTCEFEKFHSILPIIESYYIHYNRNKK